MSLGLTKTKHRISSIESTEKTTKAMELISTVKLKRFRDEFDKEKLYTDEITSLMGELFAHDKETASHYAKPCLEADRSLYIVISSNLGLCGAYNNSLFKFVDENIGVNNEIAPIGNKAIHHFERSENFKLINKDYTYIDLSTDLSVIHDLCDKLKNEFNAKKYQNIYVVYTRYINSLSFVPTLFQLLPVQLPHLAWKDEEYCPPKFDETPREMIHELLPNYLTSILYDRLVESQLSEQASRRTAMQNANDNADSLLDKLRIEYNKARQNAITQEITEVVGGSSN
jgi:F-type H+-transporting ATPase subunit gamma